MELVTVSKDGIVTLWDLERRKSREIFQSQDKVEVCDIAFCPRGKELAIASGKNITTMCTSGKCRKQFNGDSDIISLCFGCQGKKVIAYSEDKKVRMWDIKTGAHNVLTEIESTFLRVSFSPDRKKIAYGLLGSGNSNFKIKDVRGYEQTLGGHTDMVFSTLFSRDGEKVASCSNDKSVGIWNVSGGYCEKVVSVGCLVLAISFRPNGEKIALGLENGLIQIRDLNANNYRFKTLRGHSRAATSVVFSPCGTKIASASKDGTVRIWDVETGKNEILEKRDETYFSLVLFNHVIPERSGRKAKEERFAFMQKRYGNLLAILGWQQKQK